MISFVKQNLCASYSIRAVKHIKLEFIGHCRSSSNQIEVCYNFSARILSTYHERQISWTIARAPNFLKFLYGIYTLLTMRARNSKLGFEDMAKIYRRKLTPSEAKHHYIFIEKNARGQFFPPRWKVFKIRIGEEEFEVTIDANYRIWGAVFRDYIDFKEEYVFVFKKNQNGIINLSVEK